MSALVLRVAGWIAAVLLLFVMVVEGSRALEERHADAHPFVALLMDMGLRDVEREVAALPARERPARVDELARERGMPLRLCRSPGVAIGEEGVVRTARGTEVWRPLSEGEYLCVGPFARPRHADGNVGALLGVTVVFVFGAAALAVLPLARRLGAIEGAMVRLEHGELDARVHEHRRDLVGRLGVGFNRMADTLERRVRDREELLQAVAHEFGSPLSRLALHLALLEKRLDDDGTRRAESMRAALAELDQLTGELVEWVQLDAPAMRAEGAPFVLADALAGEVARLDDARVTLVDPPDVLLAGEARQFCRAVGNVLRNATQHARHQVVVRVDVDGAFVSVAVEDDGAGIPEAVRARVFEPFARGDTAPGGGLGLGLAIVRRACERHGGSATLHAMERPGTRIVLRWPLAERLAGEPNPESA